jgi:hypothetical protein
LFGKVFRAPLDVFFAAAPPIATTPYLPDSSLLEHGEVETLCAREAPGTPRQVCENAELNAFTLEHSCGFSRRRLAGPPPSQRWACTSSATVTLAARSSASVTTTRRRDDGR